MKKQTLETMVEKIAVEVVKHTEQIKELVTKEEFTKFRDENFTRLDGIMAVLTRLDQERVFTIERIKRLEEEIDKIKAHLSLT